MCPHRGVLHHWSLCHLHAHQCSPVPTSAHNSCALIVPRFFSADMIGPTWLPKRACRVGLSGIAAAVLQAPKTYCGCFHFLGARKAGMLLCIIPSCDIDHPIVPSSCHTIMLAPALSGGTQTGAWGHTQVLPKSACPHKGSNAAHMITLAT